MYLFTYMPIYILYTYYIHIIYILYTYYIHIIYILYTYYIHIIYIYIYIYTYLPLSISPYLPVSQFKGLYRYISVYPNVPDYIPYTQIPKT